MVVISKHIAKDPVRNKLRNGIYKDMIESLAHQMPGYNTAVYWLIARAAFTFYRTTNSDITNFTFFTIKERYEYQQMNSIYQQQLCDYEAGKIALTEIETIPVYVPVQSLIN